MLDVSRASALVGQPSMVLAAALANQKGLHTAVPQNNLLMKSAPDDLFRALMERLTEDEQRDVNRRVALLHAPRLGRRLGPSISWAEQTERRDLSTLELHSGFEVDPPENQSPVRFFILCALLLLVVAATGGALAVFADDLVRALNWVLTAISTQLTKVGF